MRDHPCYATASAWQKGWSHHCTICWVSSNSSHKCWRCGHAANLSVALKAGQVSKWLLQEVGWHWHCLLVLKSWQNWWGGGEVEPLALAALVWQCHAVRTWHTADVKLPAKRHCSLTVAAWPWKTTPAKRQTQYPLTVAVYFTVEAFWSGSQIFNNGFFFVTFFLRNVA